MSRGSIRNIIIGAVFVVALIIVLLQGESFFELVNTMKTGAPIPLLLAFVVQMGKYVSQGFAYSSSFRTVDEHLSPKTCFPLVFSAFFMNTVAPSLNTSGNLVYVNRARREGIGSGKAIAAVILMQTSIESGFLVIMIAGFIIIHLNGALTPAIFVVGLWVVVLVALMGGSLVLARKNPKLLMNIMRPIESFLDKLSLRFRKKPMRPWATRASEGLFEAAGEIAKNPFRASRVFLLSILASTFELACFYMVGVAFGVTSIAALLSGYVVAILFTMIAITPMGLGVVEALIVAILTAYGVPLGTAGAVSLVFRGIVFWFPFIIGVVAFQVSQRPRKLNKASANQLAPGEQVAGAPAEDVPAEGAAAEEAVVEEAAVEDSSAKEASTEDVTVVDVPAEGAAAEEAVVEDASTEDAPTEDAVVENAPVEDGVTEGVSTEDKIIESKIVEDKAADGITVA